jgi:hypothetical protein
MKPSSVGHKTEEEEAVERDRLQLVLPFVLVAAPLGISTKQSKRDGEAAELIAIAAVEHTPRRIG